MVSFGTEVSSDESEKVRAYVIHRAHETQKIEPAARESGQDAAPPVSTPASIVQ